MKLTIHVEQFMQRSNTIEPRKIIAKKKRKTSQVFNQKDRLFREVGCYKIIKYCSAPLTIWRGNVKYVYRSDCIWPTVR